MNKTNEYNLPINGNTIVSNEVQWMNMTEDNVEGYGNETCPLCNKEHIYLITKGKNKGCQNCIDNITKPIKADSKTNRNDICPCGSGKKYKKCCLK